MNKIEYLNALKEALKNIDITVMEEIVADYEEHFQVGMENGKTEEQICDALGAIDDLVKEINEVYNTGSREDQTDTDEKTKNQQEHSQKACHDKWERSCDGDDISNTIHRVIDSTSNTINHALQATSEAISKVDVQQLGSKLKSTMEHAVSRINDFTDNYYGRHSDSVDFNTMNTETYQENTTKSYDNFEPGNQKINLVVDGICADIHVRESTNGKINICYVNNGNERQKQKYAFYSFMEGNTIYTGIRVVGNAVFMFNFRTSAIMIQLEIPENMGSVDIRTASGDIRVVHVKPERMLTETASGDITFSRVDAGDYQIKTASGDIQIDNGSSVQIKAASISGDIDAKNISARDISFKSTSGDVDVENTSADIIDYSTLSGSLDVIRVKADECIIKSASGDIEIGTSTMENGNISSASGDIEMNDSTISIGEVSSASGDIQLRNSTMNNVNVSSSSGDVNLSNVAGETLRAKAASGDVTLNVNVRKCWASSKSGDIDATFNGDVALESRSTSGSININLKNYGNGYSIKSRTVSGNLSVHYNELHQRNLKTGTYTYGNQGSELILSAISGDIHVND